MLFCSWWISLCLLDYVYMCSFLGSGQFPTLCCLPWMQRRQSIVVVSDSSLHGRHWDRWERSVNWRQPRCVLCDGCIFPLCNTLPEETPEHSAVSWKVCIQTFNWQSARHGATSLWQSALSYIDSLSILHTCLCSALFHSLNCITNQTEIVVFYTFFFKKPGLGSDILCIFSNCLHLCQVYN